MVGRAGEGARESASDERTVERIAARVRELAASYRPPEFTHVPGPDAALFLCAIDHRTGYRSSHLLDGAGPFGGSELLWELGCRAERRRPGTLSAAALADVDARRVGELFEVDGETVADPGRRAALWRDLATGLRRDHGGSAAALIDAAGGRLEGATGLVGLLARYDAFSDPLAKKSFLFAKIAERRGWLDVSDPEHWQVCADNVLMRLALRSGLVEPAELDDVRAATRDAWRRVADEASLPPPVLDDLLWELGREDPDLVGTEAGELREPPRPGGLHWY